MVQDTMKSIKIVEGDEDIGLPFFLFLPHDNYHRKNGIETIALVFKIP